MMEELISKIDNNVKVNLHELQGIKEYISKLLEEIALLREENNLLKEEIKELKNSKKLNSQNSSKPPSTDRKPNNSREKTDKNSGGQKGHKGKTLELSKEVDELIRIEIKECHNCNIELSNIEGIKSDIRQVFDIVPKLIYVKEYQTEIKTCINCGCKNESKFPKEVGNKTQYFDYAQQPYGERIKATLSYLSQYQLIPFDRLSELVRDIFGQNISEGTIYNTNVDLFNKLADSENSIKESIIKEPVVNYDETGIRVNNLNYWIHVSCTSTLTFYDVDRYRNQAALEKIGILPQFKGKAIHDNYAMYFQYTCEHGLCNAHHARELKGAFQEDGFLWSSQMSDLLFKIKEEVDKSTNNKSLSTYKLLEFEKMYSKILEDGIKNYPIIENYVKKKGRKKQSKAKNLLDRFIKRREAILLFMYDFSVPFDNNTFDKLSNHQAERDIRMPKLKQKISGCFRSEDGAKIFCRIRGYVSTIKKQGLNVLESISNAFSRKPFYAN